MYFKTNMLENDKIKDLLRDKMIKKMINLFVIYTNIQFIVSSVPT